MHVIDGRPVEGTGPEHALFNPATDEALVTDEALATGIDPDAPTPAERTRQ